MKFGVVTFPGSNCDEDMIYVLENKLRQKVEKLWHKDTDLKGVDFVVLPGGFGTFDEFFEAITLIQTKKIGKFPIVLIGTDYWQGLLKWIEETVLPEGKISKEDLNLFRLEDDPKKAVQHIVDFYKKYLIKPNF